jgi:hypothetical protein
METVQPPFFGGPGGGNTKLLCPQDKPIVIGVFVLANGREFVTVSGISLYCGQAIGSQTETLGPQFDVPKKVGGERKYSHGELRCPEGEVATGVLGRSGSWLDALGLICNVPRLSSAPPAPVVPPAPVHKLGRAEAPFDNGNSSRPICDVAREARARNSPAAPGLESQCRADLASRGEAIANRDPLSAELRRRTSSDLSRRGFDIGMAVAEKDTAPGPGKQAIHDALSGVEQAAFDAAVTFSLERNRNAELATTGAAIAKADSVVAQARVADNDVFYWLGFDIATGIFGDPALGALGNTATGPGSLGIRNGLDPAAQRGFDAAVALHLSRSYATVKPKK